VCWVHAKGAEFFFRQIVRRWHCKFQKHSYLFKSLLASTCTVERLRAAAARALNVGGDCRAALLALGPARDRERGVNVEPLAAHRGDRVRVRAADFARPGTLGKDGRPARRALHKGLALVGIGRGDDLGTRGARRIVGARRVKDAEQQNPGIEVADLASDRAAADTVPI
jgi:hypothetical protein